MDPAARADHLVALVGRREEKRTLGTKEPTEAKKRFTAAMAEVEERWADLVRAEQMLGARGAINLARPFYDGLIGEFRDQPALQTKWDVEIGSTCFRPVAASATSNTSILGSPDDIRRLMMEGWCRDFARRRLEEVGLAQTEKNILAQSVIAAALQSAAIELKRLTNVTVFGSTAFLANGVGHSTANVEISSVTSKDAFDGWAAERKPTAKTLYSYERVLAELMSFVGHDNLAALTQKNVAGWKAALLTKGISSKTVSAGKLGPVRSMFQWAVDNGLLPENPGAKVHSSTKKKPGETKCGYSDDEAALVLWAASIQTKTHLRWIPLLCAYSGAQVAEISQLRKEDIAQIDGVWCPKLVPEARSLKNTNSERTVPLYPKVIEAGFLKFVNKLAAGPIFKDVPEDRFGSVRVAVTRRSLLGAGCGTSASRIRESHRHTPGAIASRPFAAGMLSRRQRRADRAREQNGGRHYGMFEVATLYREISRLP